MKLKAIRAHLVDGRAVKVGELFETGDRLGRDLVAWGKAVPSPESPAPKPQRGAMTPKTTAALVSGAGD